MSESVQGQKNSGDMPTVLKSGEEPTELLLQLVWSPLETLLARGQARVFVGKGAVAVFFDQTDLVPSLGLVPTDKESVGKTVAEVKE